MSFNRPKLPTGFKMRAHHNTKGDHQIRSGKTRDQVEAMAKRLGLPFSLTKPKPKV